MTFHVYHGSSRTGTTRSELPPLHHRHATINIQVYTRWSAGMHADRLILMRPHVCITMRYSIHIQQRILVSEILYNMECQHRSLRLKQEAPPQKLIWVELKLQERGFAVRACTTAFRVTANGMPFGGRQGHAVRRQVRQMCSCSS